MSDWVHSKDLRPKARKVHRCYLCGESIEIGEVHVRRFGFGEDGPSNFRMHAECEVRSNDPDWWDWEASWAGDMPRPSRAVADRA
jgi:hypothetical protein